MRRISAILLLTVFSFPLISAPFAEPDSNLPACCRRNGKHHCGIGSPTEHPGSPAEPGLIAARCPAFPTPGNLPVVPKVCLPTDAARVHALDWNAPASLVQSVRRIASVLRGPHQKRGPPELFS